MKEKSEIKIYQTSNGETSIEVKLDNETVWLNQYQLVQFVHKFKKEVITR